MMMIIISIAVQHERGPRTSTVRRQLQGICYSKDSSGSNSPPLDLTPKRSPESSTTCSTPPSRYIPDSHLYLSAFRPQVNHQKYYIFGIIKMNMNNEFFEKFNRCQWCQDFWTQWDSRKPFTKLPHRFWSRFRRSRVFPLWWLYRSSTKLVFPEIFYALRNYYYYHLCNNIRVCVF